MTIPHTTPGMLGRVRTSKAAIFRRLATTGALALTMFGLSVSAASAGESEQIRTKGGEVEFRARGDILRAFDTRRDGYAVRARLTWLDPVDGTFHKEYVTDPNSGGDSRARRLPIPEGITVRLKMCYIDNTGPVRCSKEQDGVA
jgi:hypothetical protein